METQCPYALHSNIYNAVCKKCIGSPLFSISTNFQTSKDRKCTKLSIIWSPYDWNQSFFYRDKCYGAHEFCWKMHDGWVIGPFLWIFESLTTGTHLVFISCCTSFLSQRGPVLGGSKSHVLRQMSVSQSVFFTKFHIGCSTFCTATEKKHVCNLVSL